MRFEWDAAKNAANEKKHGVSFEEARSVFFDDAAILFDDPDVVDGEERFLLVGLSASMRVLVVVHCIRNWERDDEMIRIISARRATKREQRACSEQWWKS